MITLILFSKSSGMYLLDVACDVGGPLGHLLCVST